MVCVALYGAVTSVVILANIVSIFRRSRALEGMSDGDVVAGGVVVVVVAEDNAAAICNTWEVEGNDDGGVAL